MAYYVSSGQVSNGIILDGYTMYVSSGGTANSTTVNSGGYLYVSSGGTALHVVWTPCVGYVGIDDDAVVTFTSNYRGVYFGSNDTLLSSALTMNGKVLSNHSMYVMNGGTANYTTVNKWGRMCVSNGGTANSTTVNSLGGLDVQDGVANRTTVNGGGLSVDSGGTANYTTVNYGGLYVHSGGTANSTTVNYDGHLRVSSGGTANSTTVYSSGTLRVDSGGTANYTTVNYYGNLYVYSGGTALNVVWTPCVGSISIDSGATVTFADTYRGVYFGSGGQLLSSATTMTDKVLSYHSMYVMNGGTANSTTVNYGGRMYVSSGGTANSTTVNSAALYVYSGGTANSTTVSNYGDLYVYSGGTANSTTVNYDGYLCISSGGMANYPTVNGYGNLYVSNGGTANSTTVNYGGRMCVSSGGTALNVVWTPCVGSVEFYDGAVVTFTSNYRGVYFGSYEQLLSSALTMIGKNLVGHTMCVMNGGVANSTTVNSRGGLYVHSGGTADYTIVNSYGGMYVSSGGTANSTTVNSLGHLYVLGGTANSTTVNEWGNLYVQNGVANSITVNEWGWMYVSSGGTANYTTVNSGGYLYVSSGGKITGMLTIANGAVVATDAGGIIDFDVSNVAPGAVARVNDLSRSQGAPVFTITVSADQAAGTYKLADGAAGFNKTITVNTAAGNTLGTLTIGGALAYGDHIYRLALNSNTLSLAVVIIDNTPPTKPTASANTTAPTNQNVTVTATFSSDSAQKQYSLDGNTWNAYTTGVVVNSNGTVYFRGIDAAGNISDVTSYAVTNIDKTPPVKPTASASTTAPTNQSVTVTATFSGDAATKQYSLNNSTWQAYTSGVVMSANGTVYFRGIDAAGNVSDVTSYAVVNIDKVAPVKPTAYASTTAPTNRNVTVTATFSNDTTTKQYSLDNSTWQEYSSGVVMSANGTVYFRGIDAAGNVSEATSCPVTNIDKVAPTINVLPFSAFALGPITIKFTASDTNDLVLTYRIGDSGGFSSYTSEGIVVDSRDYVYLRAADAAGNSALTSVFVNARYLPVSSGQVSSGITTPRGVLEVSSGCTALNTTLLSGGTLLNNGVASGITASSGAVVSGGGRLYLDSGTRIAAGVASQTQDQALIGASTFSKFVAQHDWHVEQRLLIKEARIDKGGALTFSSGASATLLDVSGCAAILSGANARSATVFSGGRLSVDGGLAAMATVSAGGAEELVNGGSALRTSVYGTQSILSGGTANSTTVYKGGVQHIRISGLAKSETLISSGGTQLVDGGSSYRADVLPGGSQIARSGGVATEATVNAGFQFVRYGGLAESTTVIRGSQYVSNGGAARKTTISGVMTSQSTTIASDYHYTGDRIYWTRDGSRTTVLSSSWNASETSTTTVYYYDYSGSQFVSSGGVAYDTRLDSGSIQTVFSGGVASDTTVNANAFQYVLKDGVASGTIVASGGICAVEYDGCGENITVANGGAIAIHGTVRNLRIAENAAYYFDMGTAVFQGDFDCYIRTTDLETLNEILVFSELDSLTLRVKTVDFKREEYDTFSTEYNGDIGYNFILVLDNGNAVAMNDNRRYVYHEELYTVEYEASESCYSFKKTTATAPGDLNGDGRADVVMTIARAGHGAYGATGAWLIQGDQTAAWGDLSQRNAGWSIFGTGTTVAGKATCDVYVKSANNVVGAWVTDDSGKVTGWKTVGEFDASTQVLGLGDFDADGQTDLLLRNTNGAVGCYFTNGRGWNYFQSLGNEWKIAAVGDLNDDGKTDVVLKHDAGFAGSWLTQEDGTMKWANLDTLPEGFSIVGCGDFDGDGTGDVLLKKGNYYGAWIVENGSVESWMGLGNLGSVTVEQIADFDGDGKDDLRIRTSAGDLGAQLVKGADNLQWKYYGSVGSEWSTSLAAI